MDKLTTVLALLAVLSMATERITEAIKGLPLWSGWLAIENKDPRWEEARKAIIQVLAIVVGTGLAYASHDQISAAMGLQSSHLSTSLVYGAMASGGSGLWNSALDIAREFNKQKQLVTDELRKRAAS